MQRIKGVGGRSQELARQSCKLVSRDRARPSPRASQANFLALLIMRPFFSAAEIMPRAFQSPVRPRALFIGPDGLLLAFRGISSYSHSADDERFKRVSMLAGC